MKKPSHKILILILIITSLITSYNFPNTKNSSAIPNIEKPLLQTQIMEKTENLKLKLEFIGFNDSLVNTTAINSKLFSNFNFYNNIPYSKFHFNFEYNFRDINNYTILKNYLLSIGVNGTDTGYEINITQLNEDLITGERNNIFTPCDGLSIDAISVEEYLHENFYEEPVNDPGYTLFILNFSEIDYENNNLEHWYDISSVGYDSNETVSWWYSSYGNLDKRSSVGWGGKYRFCYLDLSAKTWFFDFITTAWQSFSLGNPLYYEYSDMEALTQAYDPNTSLGQYKLTQYISDWINTYLGNVFSGEVDNPPIGFSYSMQIRILENLTLNGYTNEQLHWCISEERIRTILENDFPWINWHIDIVWEKLDDHPSLYQYIQSNIKENINGKYVEVMDGLFSTLEDELPNYFDLSAADEVLPSYFFLTNDISFTYYGTAFAGLGGMGWEILVGSQNTLFENGNPTELRRGMSDVMIHELGHSLGLLHPHSVYGWGSAFISDVMSYFALNSNFSSFYKDAIGRAHADAHYFYALNELQQAIELESFVEKSGDFNTTYAEIDEFLQSVPIHYQQMDYISANEKAISARHLILSIIDYYTQNTTTEKSSVNVGFLICLPIIIVVIYTNKRKRNYEL
ncbi:MAG: hypothetical protein ACFFDW_02335 [Candidatus Thorarchaeota archaeon]